MKIWIGHNGVKLLFFFFQIVYIYIVECRILSTSFKTKSLFAVEISIEFLYTSPRKIIEKRARIGKDRMNPVFAYRKYVHTQWCMHERTLHFRSSVNGRVPLSLYLSIFLNVDEEFIGDRFFSPVFRFTPLTLSLSRGSYTVLRLLAGQMYTHGRSSIRAETKWSSVGRSFFAR